MDDDVLQARQVWRAALEAVDELVDQFAARAPVNPDEWMLREEVEFAARHAYYSVLRTRFGLTGPRLLIQSL